jgi:hypothetical protein
MEQMTASYLKKSRMWSSCCDLKWNYKKLIKYENETEHKSTVESEITI